MNPRYSDVPGMTSPRPQPDWVTRGWRRRSELEPGQRLMKVEAEVERLSAELGELKSAVLYASVHASPCSPPWCDEKAEVALTELYALVPGAATMPKGGDV